MKNIKDNQPSFDPEGSLEWEPRAPAEVANTHDPSNPEDSGVFGSLWAEGDEPEPFEESSPPADLDVPLMSADAWAEASQQMTMPAELAAAPAPPAPAAPSPARSSGLNFINVGLLVLFTAAAGAGLLALSWLGTPDSDDWLDEAEQAQERGDLETASRQFSRALADGDLDADEAIEVHKQLMAVESGRQAWVDAARHARAVADGPEATAADALELAQLLDRTLELSTATPYWVKVGESADMPAQTRLRAAEALSERAAFIEAMGLYQLLRDGETREAALIGLADINMRLGDLEDAHKVLASAGRATPSIQAAQARIKLAEGDVAGAMLLLNEALSQDGNSASALQAMAQALAAQGDRTQAVAALEHAERAGGGYRAATAMGLMLAEDALRRGVNQVDMALVACTRARQAVGERPEVLDCDGVALAVQGDAERASQMLDKARKVGPGLPEVWLHRASFDARQGDPVAALERVEEALGSFPRNLDLQLRKARLLAARGQADKAEPLVKAALARYPQHPDALTALADLRAEQGRDSEATSLYKQVIGANPWQLGARYGLADALLGAGDGRGARAQYEAILALDAAQAMAWVRIAAISTVENKQGEAMQSLGKALQLGYPIDELREDPAFYDLHGSAAWRKALSE